MGNNNSQLQEAVKAAEILSISKRIEEKKSAFIIFQAETIKAISIRNQQSMRCLVPELTRHIEELNDLKHLDITSTERERCLTLIYNFEVLLVKLRSLLRSSKRNQLQESTGPKKVVDLIHLNSGLSSPSHSSQGVEEYYKLDTEIIRLQYHLQNTSFSSNELLNIKKFHLIIELKEFHNLLDRKIRELDEQREITHQIITIEQLIASSTEKQLKELEIRALKIRETIKTSSWDHCFMAKKAELLRRISGILENFGAQNRRSGDDDDELIYENLEITNNIHREKYISMPMDKPPVPLPRNPDDKIINDLATQWQRLNEILDKESLSENDKLEIVEIGQSAELAKKKSMEEIVEIRKRKLYQPIYLT